MKHFGRKKKQTKYQEQADKYINHLDFDNLEKIKKKSIYEITEEDLSKLGFERINQEDSGILYNYKDFHNIKIYFRRLPDRFELLGYMLSKKKDIFTVQELLDSSLTNWRLKLSDNSKDNFEMNSEPPF